MVAPSSKICLFLAAVTVFVSSLLNYITSHKCNCGYKMRIRRSFAAAEGNRRVFTHF
jgi:hypothetical protein